MFKKKPVQQPKEPNYKDFNEDLGFLYLVLNRKKEITVRYFINIYAQQKTDSDPITDEEIESLVEKQVKDTLNSIGDNYKNFLITKYFGSLNNLISFIAEDVYMDFTTKAIKNNLTKLENRIKVDKIAQILNSNVKE